MFEKRGESKHTILIECETPSFSIVKPRMINEGMIMSSLFYTIVMNLHFATSHVLLPFRLPLSYWNNSQICFSPIKEQDQPTNQQHLVFVDVPDSLPFRDLDLLPHNEIALNFDPVLLGHFLYDILRFCHFTLGQEPAGRFGDHPVKWSQHTVNIQLTFASYWKKNI